MRTQLLVTLNWITCIINNTTKRTEKQKKKKKKKENSLVNTCKSSLT